MQLCVCDPDAVLKAIGCSTDRRSDPASGLPKAVLAALVADASVVGAALGARRPRRWHRYEAHRVRSLVCRFDRFPLLVVEAVPVG